MKRIIPTALLAAALVVVPTVTAEAKTHKPVSGIVVVNHLIKARPKPVLRTISDPKPVRVFAATSTPVWLIQPVLLTTTTKSQVTAYESAGRPSWATLVPEQQGCVSYVASTPAGKGVGLRCQGWINATLPGLTAGA